MLAHGAGKYGGQGAEQGPHGAGLLEVNRELQHTHTILVFANLLYI